MAACKRCGAPLRWAKTAKNHKPIPLDAEPVNEGHVVFDPRGDAVVLNDEERAFAIEFKMPIFRAHFASCPEYKK